MKNQRQIILEILMQQEKDNLLLKDLLQNYENNLNNQEYGFIRTIVYGTLRYKLKLDYIISKMSKIKLNKIHRPIHNILRLSLFQLIYMGHIKESAVINEAVELAKIYGNKGSVSFVNGLLRNFLRKKDDMMEVSGLDSLDRLSIEYSTPRWIIELLKTRHEDVEEILTLLNSESPFTIRANRLLISREELSNKLKDKGFQIKNTLLSNDGLVIENPSGIINTEEFKQGLFYVQSDASQFVSETLNVDENLSILDLCAAPGGKTGHIYELSEGNSKIVACDVSKDKINLLKENFKRMKYENIELLKNDATKYKSDFENQFDICLVDAPCSSLGLINRMPELKYNKSIDDIKTLAKKQLNILNNAYKYVKMGGTLLYSTCTFTIQENEDVIKEFLAMHSDMHIENIEDKNTFFVNPLIYNTDMFCITKLRKDI